MRTQKCARAENANFSTSDSAVIQVNALLHGAKQRRIWQRRRRRSLTSEFTAAKSTLKKRRRMKMSEERHEMVTDNVSANHQFREVAKMIPHEEVDVSKMETTTPTSEKSSAVGNAAAMREALMEARIVLSSATHHHMTEDDAKDCLAVIETAISAPPRNCDKQLPAKRVSSDDVEQAWLVFKRRDPNVYFDVPGLLRFIVWLFDDAQGETDGSK